VQVKPLTIESHGLDVLVVDDNRDAADTLGLLLQIWGHRVRVAYDGPSALSAVLASPPEFVFLDIGMPSMDGYAIAHRIKTDLHLSAIRIIALTAYSDDEHLKRVWEEGFDGYMNKPADPLQIKRILELNSHAAVSMRGPIVSRRTRSLIN
jgi:CheY-like chemotaxis protein